MKTLKTWKQGLWRAPGHFIIWGACSSACGYFLYWCGFPLTATLGMLLIISTVLTLLVSLTELVEYLDEKQSAGKCVIDWLAKVGGLAFGIVSAGWWWK